MLNPLFNKRAGRLSHPTADLPFIVGSVCFFVALGLLALAWCASYLTGNSPDSSLAEWVLNVLRGESTWNISTTAVFALLVILVAFLGVSATRLASKFFGISSRSDKLAKSMSKASDYKDLHIEYCAETASNLKVDAICGPGVPIGKAVLDGRQLATSWEWTQIWVMGPRAGKTSSLCVPQMLSTGGPVLATTNKPDLVHLTRGSRSEHGLTWIHDPQQLESSDKAKFWWSPLSYIQRDVTKADQLVSLFAAASRDAAAKTDAFFDVAGSNLLSLMLLAASTSDDTSMFTVREWLHDPEDETPEDLLFMAGFRREAFEVASNRRRTEKQRDGVYATSESLLGWLKSPNIEQWITPGEGRVEFKPSDFVRGTDTLYLLSKEGPGSARAVTASLTVAVTDAAERFAVSQGGRLARPLLCTLDEAANVCRWPQLPDLYSHYGSRGIILTTYLQSWSQGERVWGREGIRQMWDAANLRGVGRGVADSDFAAKISTAVGDHDVRTRSKSVTSKGGSTMSYQLRRERILDPADIVALEQGRAICLPAGAPPTLVSLQHWSSTKFSDEIEESLSYYGSSTT